jgi:hypothetical protein
MKARSENAWTDIDGDSGFSADRALPLWSNSRSWGYYPSGGVGSVLVIIVILMVLGRI